MIEDRKLKVVFFASPDFTVDLLRHFHEHPTVDLCYVWTKKNEMRVRGKVLQNSLLIDFCQTHNIPYDDEGVIGPKQEAVLSDLKVDVGFVVAYGVLFRSSFFNIPPHGLFNLHFSLLPKYRGASPVQSAILNGDSHSGITLQRIVKGLDKGDVAFQSKFNIVDRRADEVFSQSIYESKSLINRWVESLLKGNLHCIPQLEDDATYCSKYSKDSGYVGANDDVREVYQKYLGLYPWPGLFFKVAGVKYDVLEVERQVLPSDGASKGCMVREGKKLYLSFPMGRIELLKVKMEGKKALSVVDFLNGSGLNFPCFID